MDISSLEYKRAFSRYLRWGVPIAFSLKQTELVRARYRAMALEELLPDIVFPLEENARAIAEEIRQINQDMHREMFGKKSAVWDALNFSEAADAFVALVGNIVAGVRESIEETITAQAGSEQTETDIVQAVERTVSDYQARIIPHKLDMLATHFNGKLSELEQRRAGGTPIISGGLRMMRKSVGLMRIMMVRCLRGMILRQRGTLGMIITVGVGQSRTVPRLLHCLRVSMIHRWRMCIQRCC